jgi:flagellar basal-body rod modification protein FlgD
MANATGAADSSGSSSGADSSSSTISSNDFLSLLVTEMQNQDPTADTDPNEYINQLVQVNSLEQLIDINQNLSTVLGTSGNPSGSDTAGTVTRATQTAGGKTPLSTPGANPTGAVATANAAAHKTVATTSALPGRSSATAGISQFANSQFAKSQPAAAKHAPGNLGIPKADPAAHKVAQALDGHARPLRPLHKLPGAQ